MKLYDRTLTGRSIKIIESPLRTYIGRKVYVLKERGNTLLVYCDGKVKTIPKKGLIIEIEGEDKIISYKQFEGSYLRRLRKI